MQQKKRNSIMIMKQKKLHIKTRKRVRTFTRRQSIGLVLGLAGIALAFLFAYLFFNRLHKAENVQSAGENVSASSTSPVMLNERDLLTGVFVEHAKPNKQIYGVMIDEHVDARPQTGVDQAFLVIEAPVEAGIPRLLAFFSADQKIDKIGPVRSARPYFVDWVNEFDALYAHVGGSNEALDKISTGITFDLNQFWHDAQFWRAQDRYAPYNVYSSTDLLVEYVQKKKDSGHLSNPLYGVWKFKDADALPDGVRQKFSIVYFAPEYITTWSFDSSVKGYVSNNASVVREDKTSTQVIANNVAVVLTDITVMDKIGRRKIRTIGTGKAFVFQDGKKINGTWKKPSITERLRFFDAKGEEISMNA